MNKPLVILDADGVFLNERPYWDSALAAALAIGCVSAPTDDDWRKLAVVAFESLGLQRVTKRRGCNSNFDLAAVLALALCDSETRLNIEAHLAQKQWGFAVEEFIQFAERAWQRNNDTTSTQCANVYDPLAGFGIDRYGEHFADVQGAFQRALLAGSKAGGTTEASPLRGGAEAIRRAFDELTACGFELAVCTGRVASELLTPMKACGLTPFFAADRLISGDYVTQAEIGLKTRPLGKPHWFPLVCAAAGEAIAREAVKTGRVQWNVPMRMVYVGDGLADFQSAYGARSVGLPIDYIHVRSGVTDSEAERSILDASFTLAIVDELSEVPSTLRAWLGGVLS